MNVNYASATVTGLVAFFIFFQLITLWLCQVLPQILVYWLVNLVGLLLQNNKFTNFPVFSTETVLSQVFDFPQLWLCRKSCQAICRRRWSLGLPSQIGAKISGNGGGDELETVSNEIHIWPEKQKKHKNRSGVDACLFLKKLKNSWILMIWFDYLGGGFKWVDFQFDYYFLDGLKAPTSDVFFFHFLLFVSLNQSFSLSHGAPVLAVPEDNAGFQWTMIQSDDSLTLLITSFRESCFQNPCASLLIWGRCHNLTL